MKQTDDHHEGGRYGRQRPKKKVANDHQIDGKIRENGGEEKLTGDLLVGTTTGGLKPVVLPVEAVQHRKYPPGQLIQ